MYKLAARRQTTEYRLERQTEDVITFNDSTMRKSGEDQAQSVRTVESLEKLLAATSSPRPLLRPHFWRMRPDKFCRALTTQFFTSGSADEVEEEQEEDILPDLTFCCCRFTPTSWWGTRALQRTLNFSLSSASATSSTVLEEPGGATF